MTDVQTFRVAYTGPAAFVSLVAQVLREDGLVVSFTPPEESRGAQDVAEAVAVGLTVTGIEAAVRAAVAKVRERLRERRVTVEIDETDDQRASSGPPNEDPDPE